MPSAEARPPRLSVIVPVYRDWDRLRLCLQALAAQDWPAGDVEWIAVNNDEQPAPDEFRHWPGLRLLQEPQGHSYAARNAAIRVARGEVLAFTDADCQPAPGWLRAGWDGLHGEAAGLLGGRIVIDTGQAGLIADYDRCFAFRQEQTVREGGSVTANLFVRRAVIEQIGPFNASLQSGGDFEFCRRAVAAGFRLVYGPAAVVGHPARDSLGALLRKNRRVAGGFRRRELELSGRSPAERRQLLMGLAKPRLYYWLRLLRGQEKTGGLPAHRRAALTGLQILLHYHFGWSVLRPPPGKDQHS